MRGRKPLPADVVRLRGNPGCRPIRSPPRPTILSELPPPPPFLTDEAITCWQTTGAELIRVGVLSSLDLAVLGAYADSYGRWVQILRLMKDVAPSDPRWRVFSRTARQAKHDFVRFAQELGATPVSRSRVSVSPGGGGSKFGHL